jgi:hypothetical protein
MVSPVKWMETMGINVFAWICHETMGSQMNAIAIPWKAMGSLQQNNKIHFS